jgi:putative membrane protein
MKLENKTIRTAEFHKEIKTYILLVVAFFLFVSIAGIPLLIFWFLGIGQFMSKRYYQSLTCQLTEQHLAFSKGYLFNKEKTIPLENIQDLTFIQNPILNLLGLKILKIETAGQSNPQGMSDMRLVGIVNAAEFKQAVLEQRAQLKEYYRGGNTISTNQDDPNIALLTEIRDLLMEIKEK